MKVILMTSQSQRNPLTTQDSLKQYILLFFLIISCDFYKENNNNFVAKAGDHFLTYSDLEDQIPNDLSETDSIRLAKNIIEKWAINKLLMQNAQLNLSDNEIADIDKLSNNYRETLTIDKYKNKISKNNSDTIVTETEIEKFYKSNNTNFKLYDDIIKGRYIKLNKNNFNLNEIKRRFNRFNIDDKSFFDSISIQILNYYLKDSIWINKESFFNKIPSVEKDEAQRIVKNNLFYIKEDSLALYLIKINNYKKANDYAPLDYIYNRIKELILSKKNIDYLNKVDKELLYDAITKNRYERFD